MPQSEKPSSASLAAIEAAALQLLHAVRSAGNGFASQLHPLTLAGKPPLSVPQLFNEFMLSKARAGRSDNYLRITHTALANFASGRERMAVASVSASEIEGWLYSQKWQPRTVKNNLGILRTVLAWAVTRGELAGNVALGIDAPTIDNDPPEIHTPAEVRHVLETARGIDLNTARFLAVRYFGGLRASEAAALEENEIGEKFIEVTAAKAKTRRRRLVTIQPVLRAWLALGGCLPLRQVNNRLRAVTLALGQRWPKNAPRHSFCSYHLAKFQNAGKTALEAGHTEQVLFNSYREIVTPADADEFWSILPKRRSRIALERRLRRQCRLEESWDKIPCAAGKYVPPLR